MLEPTREPKMVEPVSMRTADADARRNQETSHIGQVPEIRGTGKRCHHFSVDGVCCWIHHFVGILWNWRRSEKQTGRGDPWNKPQLEAGVASTHTAVLQNDPGNFGEDGKWSVRHDVSSETARGTNRWWGWWRNKRSASKDREGIVPTTLIGPHKFKKFRYETTSSSLDMKIEANTPVSVYIIQLSDLENWKTDRTYDGWSFPSGKIIQAKIKFPKHFELNWYLVVYNKGEEPAAVHYELFDR